ncbi:MAG TPA: polysaccharide biosynthesis/export family protein [Pyrinomonadaceae bacterium]
MKAVNTLCALMLLTTLVALPLRAQQQPAADGQTQSFSPARSTSSAPEAVGSGSKDYPLGPGDVVELRVFGEPQFDGDYNVDSAGTLTVPFIEQPIDARCRNINQIQKEVVTSLAKFLRKPQVYMRVKEQHSRPAAVIYGAVRVPTQFQMHRRARLLELISNSGGVTEQANGTIQITHREEAICPEPDELTEAQSGVQGADASGLVPFTVYKVGDLKLGKPEANPFIRPGDIVYVAEASPIYITGAVTSPQGLYLRERLTLSTALAMVGGIKKEAKSSEVRIYRQQAGSATREAIVADYRKIQRKQQPDIELQPYDVIEVPEKGLNIGKILLGFATGGAQSFLSAAPVRVLY